MSKQKMKAQVSVADGAGGMAPLEDERFGRGPSCEPFEIPSDEADEWFKYLKAECSSRGWSSGGITQIDSEENSGSLTINTGSGSKSPKIIIVWERSRSSPLRLTARPGDSDLVPIEDVHHFLNSVNERWRSKTTEQFHRQGQLHYNGLPWQGELWLDAELRLGPPSRHATWLIAPQVVLIDAIVEGVEWSDANGAFDRRLREIELFLAVVLASEFRLPPQGHAWTFETGKSDCELRSLGYLESVPSKEMPVRGKCKAIPMKELIRPDTSRRGITSDDTERWVPNDIADLWNTFDALSPDHRHHFVDVGRVWKLAISLFREHKTASFAFMWVACEAMKPRWKKFNDKRAYDVIEALLGTELAERVRKIKIDQNHPPNDIRDQHFHRAKSYSPNSIADILASTFIDPSFDEAYDTLWVTTHAALIEWLSRGCSISSL